MTERVVIYERELEVPIKISKKISEDAKIRKLERWPKEAGLSVPLDDSGVNFTQMVKMYVSDYGLELGEKKWHVESNSDKIVTKMEWKIVKNGNEVGIASMSTEISKFPSSEERDNYVHTCKLKYVIEIESSIVAEKASAVENIPDMSLF